MSGQVVDVRRFYAFGTVARKVAIAQVVRHEQDDIGAFVVLCMGEQ